MVNSSVSVECTETCQKSGEFSVFSWYPVKPLYTPLLTHFLPPINPLYAIYIKLINKLNTEIYWLRQSCIF